MSARDDENPYKKGVRFSAVGAAAATIGVVAGSIGSTIGAASGSAVAGQAIGAAGGAYLGYQLGGSTGEYLGVDRTEASYFGLSVGLGASLGGPSSSAKPPSNKNIDWAGGRLIKR